MRRRTIKVPMGWDHKLTDVNRLSNHQIDSLLNNDISRDTRDAFGESGVSVRDARSAALGVAGKRRLI